MSTSEEIWQDEYLKIRSLPSSYRIEPSRGLVMLDGLLPLPKIKHALDLGCGTGRNTIYLLSKGLKVDAIDFSDAALFEFRKRLKGSKFSGRVRIVNHNLLEPIPFDDAVFDLVIDFYNFCQFIGEEERLRYLNDVRRLLKPEGYAIFALFSVEDGYYRRFLPRSGDTVVTDPANRIVTRLYSKDEVTKMFGMFQNPFFISLEFDDMMQQSFFRRVIFVLVLKRG